jgi:hypothetical protein
MNVSSFVDNVGRVAGLFTNNLSMRTCLFASRAIYVCKLLHLGQWRGRYPPLRKGLIRRCYED